MTPASDLTPDELDAQSYDGPVTEDAAAPGVNPRRLVFGTNSHDPDEVKLYAADGSLGARGHLEVLYPAKPGIEPPAVVFVVDRGRTVK